jgi:hypothetical protein
MLTSVTSSAVMASVILIDDANALVARRVRLRDRLRARFRAFALDQALAAGAPPEKDAALTLRARTLIDERTRCELGSALRRLVIGADRRPSVVHVPASSPTLDGAGDLLDELAIRLLAPAPVEARGVAQARLLLSDGTSPLFWSRRSAQSRERVQRALSALEPASVE